MGKAFDILLIAAIVSSLTLTILETVESLGQQFPIFFFTGEIVLTAFFTVEYALRIYSSKNTKAYAFSFYGLVDLFSTLPLYISVFIPGAQSISIVRGLRMLRIFRILKLNKYALASDQLKLALRQSWPKIFVFLVTIVTSIAIMGSLMYLIEGRANGFSSIPKGIYWAVVTMTTVGYGDLVPQTDFGQFVAIVLMVLGYGVIAVPTGIISSEIIKTNDGHQLTKTCSSCFQEGHRLEANFCDNCGASLEV